MANDKDTPTSAYLRRPLRSREDAEITAARLRLVNKMNHFIRRDQLRLLEAEVDRLIALGKGGAS